MPDDTLLTNSSTSLELFLKAGRPLKGSQRKSTCCSKRFILPCRQLYTKIQISASSDRLRSLSWQRPFALMPASATIKQMGPQSVLPGPVQQLNGQGATQGLQWSFVDKPLPKNHLHWVYLLKYHQATTTSGFNG